MRVLGNLSGRQFEAHMTPEWNSPAQVTVIWRPDLENPEKLKRAVVILLTWRQDGDRVPYWLMEELKSQAAYLFEHWIALH